MSELVSAGVSGRSPHPQVTQAPQRPPRPASALPHHVVHVSFAAAGAVAAQAAVDVSREVAGKRPDVRGALDTLLDF